MPSTNKRSAPGDLEQSSAVMKKPRKDVQPLPQDAGHPLNHSTASDSSATAPSGSSLNGTAKPASGNHPAQSNNEMQLYDPNLHPFLAEGSFMNHIPAEQASFPSGFQHSNGHIDSAYSNGYGVFPRGVEGALTDDQRFDATDYVVLPAEDSISLPSTASLTQARSTSSLAPGNFIPSGGLMKGRAGHVQGNRGYLSTSETWQLVGQELFIDPSHHSDWQLVQDSDTSEFVNLDSGRVEEEDIGQIPSCTTQLTLDDSVDGGQRQRRRGPFTDPLAREETGITRKLKACVRCRIQRVRCLPDPENLAGVCLTCKNVSRPVVHNLPCLRYKVTEMILTRLRIRPRFEHRWPSYKISDISDWADSNTKKIKIKMNYCSKPFEVDVRRFNPIKGDVVEKSWVDGNSKRSLKVAAYAINNMDVASKELQNYIDSTMYEWLSLSLFDCDELVQETFKMAERHAKVALIPEEKVLLQNLFRLWYVIRQTAIMEHIVGEETLGMSADSKDRPAPLKEKIPLPPIMSHQLDMMLSVKLVRPLKKRVLDNLQRIIIANRPKSWFTIYLCMFILLHSSAVLTRHRYDYARARNMKERFSLPEFVQELHHGSNVLLAHFHYWNSDCHPFSLNWKERHNTPLAELTPEQVQFMIRTTQMVKDKEAELRIIRDSEIMEHELFFVSQLFDKDWVPRDTIVV